MATLFELVRAGDRAGLQAALAGGAHPDPFDAEGATPLARAAEAGDAEAVRLLLAHGADPGLTDLVGEPPLHKAAAHGHRDACALLLPFASAEEQDLAQRLLRTAGVQLPPGPPAAQSPERWRRALAELSVSLSALLGDAGSVQRLERAKRSRE